MQFMCKNFDDMQNTVFHPPQIITSCLHKTVAQWWCWRTREASTLPVYWSGSGNKDTTSSRSW